MKADSLKIFLYKQHESEYSYPHNNSFDCCHDAYISKNIVRYETLPKFNQIRLIHPIREHLFYSLESRLKIHSTPKSI